VLYTAAYAGIWQEERLIFNTFKILK